MASSTLSADTIRERFNSRAIIFLFTTGEGLRGDFKTAFDKTSKEGVKHIAFVRLDPRQEPELAAHFDVGEKAVMIAWLDGEELVRRLRPWGTDLPLAVELLQSTLTERAPDVVEAAPAPAETKDGNVKDTQLMNEPNTVYDAPVTVTDATFEDEVLNSEIPVLVDFWAEWCGPCRMVGPILDKLAKEYAGQIKIAKVNVDENPALSQAFRIQSIPNLMIVKQRTMIFNQPGALPEPAFRSLIDQAIALEIPAQTEQSEQ